MIRRQFLRYAAVGVTLNVALYVAYLLLTHSLMGSRAAMTLTYCSGVGAGYILNRTMTFRHCGRSAASLPRYVVVYLIGYGLDFLALWLLTSRMGVPHQLVQGGVTVVLPIVLFALQKYWVFPVHTAGRVPVRAGSAP